MDIEGIAASPGIAIGPARKLKKKDVDFTERDISENETKEEIKSLESALEKAEEQLQEIKENIEKRAGKEEAEIISAHQMILQDPELIPKIKDTIKNDLVNAEAAVARRMDEYAKIFADMDDDYMKAREEDILDVRNRIIKILTGAEEIELNFSDLEDVILVAEELAPSDTAGLDTDKIKAFVTAGGSRTSHSAIMARSMGVPAVVGIGEKIEEIETGMKIIVDGRDGNLKVAPEEEVIDYYRSEKKKEAELKDRLEKYKNKKAETKDEVELEVAGNIGNPEEASAVLEEGGEGIGLFRTEFLYMEREDLPDEEEQYQAYRKAAEKMNGRPVVIRTLDIGGDKNLPYLDLPDELNPFLGFRAIRFCLEEENIFKTQLKALLRAAAHGDVRIMYPLISTIEEIRAANEILSRARKELEEDEVDFGNPQVGIMVEVPAAAVNASALAKEVDFFSIGTNDLIQYTMAVDRMNSQIADLHNPYHPAVLSLIKQTIEAGHSEDIWVGMCGEAAGDELLFPFLLGAGLDEFSMSPVSITRIKYLMEKWSISEAEKVVDEVLSKASDLEVKNYLQKLYDEKMQLI